MLAGDSGSAAELRTPRPWLEQPRVPVAPVTQNNPNAEPKIVDCALSSLGRAPNNVDWNTRDAFGCLEQDCSKRGLDGTCRDWD